MKPLFLNRIPMLLTKDTGNAMEQLETTANNFFADIQLYVFGIIVIIALITNGIMMAVGSDESRDKARKSFKWVLLGCVCVLGASTIAAWITGNIAFGG